MDNAKYCFKLVVDRDDEVDSHDWLPPLDRRVAVRMLGMSALATLVGCAASSSASSSSALQSSGTTATTTTLTTSSTTTATGTSITLTAAVSPSAASGTVTFYKGRRRWAVQV